MSEPANSCGHLARMQARSSATLPAPTITACAPSSGGARSAWLEMAVVPAAEGRGPDHAGQAVAGHAERPVGRRPGREHNGVVQFAELGHRDVRPDVHVADEPHVVGERGRLVPARHRLDRLVVERDARTDQAEGDGQAVEDVHMDAVSPSLERRLGGGVSRRPRSDHRDAAHALVFRSEKLWPNIQVRQGRDPTWTTSTRNRCFRLFAAMPVSSRSRWQERGRMCASKHTRRA